MRIKAFPLFLGLTVALFSACWDPTTPIERPPVAVTLTVPTPTLTIGQTTTLTTYVANDTTGVRSGVTWSSAPTAVATVNAATGLVTAVAPGTVTITATSKLDPTKSASAQLTVTAAARPPVSVTMTASATTMAISQKFTFVASVANDTTGALSGVTWTSSAPAQATVSATGEVTAISSGTTTIKATSKLDPTKSASIVVTIAPPAPIVLPVLGTGLVTERFTAEVAVGNGFAYTTTWGTRLGTNRGDAVKIWNVSGSTPVLVDSLKLANTGTTSDVQISPDGTLLVVSTEGLSTGSIAIYSMATPAKPTLITRYQTTATQRGVHTVKLGVVNNKLYGFLNIDPTAALVIVDLSNPAVPTQVFNQVMGSPYIHDVFFRDGLLFAALWNDGMTIFDVGGGGRGGSPSNPVVISTIKTTTGKIHNIWWFHDPQTGSKRYAFLGEEGSYTGAIGSGTETSVGDIHVVDVSNLAAPREVAIYTVANAGTHNFWVDEASGVLYAAYYNGGVRAIDIRGDLGTCAPSQRTTIIGTPVGGACDLRLMGREMATALTPGYFVWGVFGVGTRLYASDMGKGLVVLDIASLKR
ncbi:MAG: Ig-like domain-containing protein [Longimicrobiales bacterium]